MNRHAAPHFELPDYIEVGTEGPSSTLPQELLPMAGPVATSPPSKTTGAREAASPFEHNYEPTRPPELADEGITLPQDLDALVDAGLAQHTQGAPVEQLVAGPSSAKNYSIGGPKSRRVLMVDDDPTARLYMRAKLMLRGNVEMVEASSGPQALMVLKTQSFDAVLLDVDMGAQNGFEVCRTVRQMVRQQGGRQPRIYMVTSRSSLLDKMRARMAGADAFLSKPPHPGELADLLAQL